MYAYALQSSPDRILVLNWTARQTGKTTSVIGAATDDDIIVVENRHVAVYVMRQLEDKKTLVKTKSNEFRGMQYTNSGVCYIDTVSISPIILETIAHTMKNPKIIVLGRVI